MFRWSRTLMSPSPRLPELVPHRLLEFTRTCEIARTVEGATLQAILNVIDFGMSPVEAVTVPRIHCEGKGIQAEATVQGAVIAELRAIGHKVVHSPHSFEPMMSPRI